MNSFSSRFVCVMHLHLNVFVVGNCRSNGNMVIKWISVYYYSFFCIIMILRFSFYFISLWPRYISRFFVNKLSIYEAYSINPWLFEINTDFSRKKNFTSQRNLLWLPSTLSIVSTIFWLLPNNKIWKVLKISVYLNDDFILGRILPNYWTTYSSLETSYSHCCLNSENMA